VASLRWRKLRGDLRAARGRVAVMTIALAISLIGFGTVLGARTVLAREIERSYLSSQPADATLELPAGIDPAVLAEVRARPEIAAASAREVVMARVATGRAAPAALQAHLAALSGAAPAEARPLQLFVEDDFADRGVQRVRRVSGAWPPPPATMALERTALRMLGVAEGDTVMVTTPHGRPRPIAISGVVHDTALAPAWQEHKGYGYVTRATLAGLGEPPVLHDLYVRFRPAPQTQAEAEAAATALARALGAAGHAVREVRVPRLRSHPHAGQMRTAQLALLVFSVLLLVLSAILVATLLAALLARQVREIGVMKAIGARTGQLAALYAALVAVIGALALAAALPLAYLGAHAFIAEIAGMMNLAIDDPAIPGWVFVAQGVAGLAVPLAIAALPIWRACRLTVRAALAQHGAREVVRVAPTWLPHAARNALRTPVRLALATSLLVAGGAMAMTAFNVKRAYERNVARMPAMWHYDVDLWLREPAPAALAGELGGVAGVRAVEPWAFRAAGPVRADGLDLAHTYPDQGHGRFRVYGVPPATTLATLPLFAGRWLTATDRDAIVLGKARGAAVGDRVALSLEGEATRWTVVGVVDALPDGNGFVTAEAFAAATHAPASARLFRVAFAPGADRAQATAGLVRVLDHAGAAVELIEPFSLMRAALDDHVLVITRAAVVLAAIMALVGLFGLAAAMGVSVLERTREIGVMKAIGAGDRRIFRLIVGEAVVIGAASWAIATGLVLPATYALDGVLSAQGFITAAFVVSPLAIAGWLVAAVAGSAIASFVPARRAARLTVREALAEG
jgi:putative ABC transport system permease protein